MSTKIYVTKNKSKPTKGWHEDAPKSKSERETLLTTCGSKCFLNPSEKKFPICSKNMSCALDCRGILSAKIRARQWKYEVIGDKADKIYKKKCT